MRRSYASHLQNSSNGLETLEDRRLFAVAIGFVAPDMLTFTGDGQADTLVLKDNGAGVFSGERNNAVGAMIPFGPIGGIRRIQVQMNGNNDTVRYELGADPTTGRQVSVDLGSGNDYFTMTAAPDIDFAGNTYLALKVTGQAGDDYLTAFHRGELDGRMELILDGGDGNDRLVHDVMFDAGSTGGFVARSFGGNGNDFQHLLVRKTLAADPVFINALASGGAGWDNLTRTPWAANDATCEIVAVVP
jgi:hypothetical protein